VKQTLQAGHVPSMRGALRVAKGELPTMKNPNRATVAAATRTAQNDAAIMEALDRVLDGKRRTDSELTRIAPMPGPDFLQRVRLIPWVTVDRTAEGTILHADQPLRDICEGHRPRPTLDGGQSIAEFLRHLRAEIRRRRKENNDEFHKRKWNSELILKREQTGLRIKSREHHSRASAAAARLRARASASPCQRDRISAPYSPALDVGKGEAATVACGFFGRRQRGSGSSWRTYVGKLCRSSWGKFAPSFRLDRPADLP
jgi:hypothetical protein